jgi:hypothetical protein
MIEYLQSKVLNERFTVRGFILAQQKKEGKLTGVGVASRRYCKHPR